jgi:putative ABC transport system substrate-binding protein
MVRLKVDVLLVGSTDDALAAKKASHAVPVVFYNVTDPVGAGLVDSLARPGGNITGITNLQGVLAGKRMELLKETVPKVSRVAVLWNPQDVNAVQQWKESQLPARDLGLHLLSMEVNSAEKFEDVFKAAAKADATALAVIGSPLIGLNVSRIVGLSEKNRLPAIYPRAEFVTSGGLMSYGADEAEPFQRVAVFVDKILKGTKPADIPVEQPTKFEFAINIKAAKQIGLTIPQSVLFRADRVIK